MRLNFIISILCTLVVQRISAQGMTEQQKQAVEWLDSKKAEFQTTSDDSLFITKNSDSPYRYIYLRRGDEPEDVEEEIYKSKPGTVVGPFRSGSHNYLFKVISLDSSRYRFKVRHIFIKPEGFEGKDTAEAYTMAVKYAKLLNKGKDFKELFDDNASNNNDFKKYAAQCGFNPETVGSDGDLGWIWEGTTIPVVNAALLKTRKGESVALKTPYGAHVFKIISKEPGYYKAVIISLLKRVKK
jgi:peptidyl-prolyl cis-trans isomerase D